MYYMYLSATNLYMYIRKDRLASTVHALDTRTVKSTHQTIHNKHTILNSISFNLNNLKNYSEHEYWRKLIFPAVL